MNARRLLLAAVISLTAAPCSSASAAEPPPGASSCSGCHPAQAGVDTSLRPLAGRPASEMVALMHAFRAGERQPTIMDQIVKGFSDAELAAIAAWYAEQKAPP